MLTILGYPKRLCDSLTRREMLQAGASSVLGLGLAFEKFNAVGKYRETDGELPIDCTAELPSGKKVNGVDDLRVIVREKKDLVSRNLTEKMLTYAVGRGLDFYDRRTVDGVVSELQKNEYRIHTLIIAVVQSDPFRTCWNSSPMCCA
jgi:hypothetical protein